MVVKVFISGISGNKEVKKRQQRVLMILDSKNIKYEVIDITEPGREADKDFMQHNSKSNGGTVSDPNPRSPLPPQIFNDQEYCGDYDQFDLANEVDTLEQFVKVEEPPQINNEKENTVNGVEAESKEEKSDLNEEVLESKSEETSNDKLDAKESSPVKEGTPPKDAASKEGSPTKDDGEENQDTKEKSPETDRQKSEEKENSPDKAQSPEKETEQASKEHTPDKEVIENGTASSRDHSEEKESAEEPTVESKKDNPSEALIESEQAAAAE